jgi:hypothetical protein
MKKSLFSLFAIALLVVWACSEDDNSGNQPNAVAFPNPSLNLSQEITTLNLVFQNPTPAAGEVTLSVSTVIAEYGTDFTTQPAVVNNTLVVPFAANATSAPFTFNRLVEATEDQIKHVTFTITGVTVSSISIPEPTKSLQVNFDEAPITSATVSPGVGGPTVPNQVFFDLSSGIETPVDRTRWDLGFHAGDEFRVAINGSLKMAVKQINQTDMTLPITIDESVAVGEGVGTGVTHGNIAYVDGPNGAIQLTAMQEVSSNDADNKVYLVNMGFGLTNVVPNVGSVNPYGEHRGWMKIRVLRSGNGYKLQYAAPQATTFSEVTLAKNNAFNFTFFSLVNQQVVTVQPQKDKWDILFTPFTNHTNFGGGPVSYAFQDFIVTNRLGGVSAYQVLNSAGVTYPNFTLANVVQDNFTLEASIDQRVIGSNWRTGGGPTSLPSPRDDRFYVLKDPAGNIYKIRFIAMTNGAGERGNPTFEYQKLN